MRWEGSAMLRSSPRRTLEAIVTEAIALIVALAAADLKQRQRGEACAIKRIKQSIKLELLASHDF
jgi:hypothetical protein